MYFAQTMKYFPRLWDIIIAQNEICKYRIAKETLPSPIKITVFYPKNLRSPKTLAKTTTYLSKFN